MHRKRPSNTEAAAGSCVHVRTCTCTNLSKNELEYCDDVTTKRLNMFYIRRLPNIIYWIVINQSINQSIHQYIFTRDRRTLKPLKLSVEKYKNTQKSE